LFLHLKKKLPHVQFYEVAKRNVSYQRNFGVSKAHGKYLVFFDADVMVSSQFLMHMHKAVMKRDSTLLTTWVVPDSSDPIDRVFSEFGNMCLSAVRMLGMQFAGGFNLIVERFTFDMVNGFDEAVVHAEDHDFVGRLGNLGVSLDVLPSPRLIYSFRRFRKEGRLKVVGKYTYSSLHLLLKGSITNDLFEYQMGGEHYLASQKNSQLSALNAQLKQRLRHIIQHTPTMRLVGTLETSLAKSLARTKSEAQKLTKLLDELVN